MKLLFLSILLGTLMQFKTLSSGESHTFPKGINFMSVTCADCDVIISGDTLNLVSQGFDFPVVIGQSYDEIKIISNADGTKIGYSYANR
tara:strand:- start:115 stop:381 length:267 start_codon:yes stop_codon:yes gene_type:complete